MERGWDYDVSGFKAPSLFGIHEKTKPLFNKQMRWGTFNPSATSQEQTRTGKSDKVK